MHIYILLLRSGTELSGKLFLLMFHMTTCGMEDDTDLIPFWSDLINVLAWGSLTEQDTITFFF